jgi:hypothetical protein
MPVDSPLRTSPAASSPESVNVRLASYLCERREVIMLDWLDRLRADPKIANDSMTTLQGRDHVPNLFDDLAETLRLYPRTSTAEQSHKDGEEHGSTRWKEGYSLPEVLREIKHLRAVLVHHLAAFEELNPDFGLVPRLFATSMIHAFFDNLALDATERFAELGDED